jgi:ArsR family transcriptional regulator
MAIYSSMRRSARAGDRPFLSARHFLVIGKALAEPMRCDILNLLQFGGEKCCQEIWRELPVTQATVSHHLKALTQAGLVYARRAGQFTYYAAESEVIEKYLRELRRRIKPR